MEEGRHIFTVEEANALIPVLQLELGGLAFLRSRLERAIEDVGGAEPAVAVLHGKPAPRGREGEATRLRRLAEEVTAAVERVNALGCVLKDIEAGLVDFHAELDGELVFLCWQLGEPAVAHWHPLDGGFAARQPLDDVEVEPPRFFN